MLSALMFVLGFSTVFIALGASASVIGLIRAKSAQLSIVAGIVIIIMGLHFLGLTRIAFLMRERRLPIPKPVAAGAAEVPSGERRTGNGCIVGRDGGCVPDREHVGHQHLAARDGAAEFRLTSRNNSGFRNETPAAARAKFKQLIWGAL
jgi:hypothetical protein